MIPKSVFPALDADVPALEFGGWPLFCRADFPDELAYSVGHSRPSIQEKTPCPSTEIVST